MPFTIPFGRSFFKKIELAIKISCFIHFIGEHVTEVTMVLLFSFIKDTFKKCILRIFQKMSVYRTFNASDF